MFSSTTGCQSFFILIGKRLKNSTNWPFQVYKMQKRKPISKIWKRNSYQDNVLNIEKPNTE